VSPPRAPLPRVVMPAVAAPAALGLETVLRSLLFPPDFEVLRETLHVPATVAAWVLVLICAALVPVAFVWKRHLFARRVRRLEGASTAATEEQRKQAVVGAYMLAASLPQVPAVLATLAFLFGASIVPVAATLAIVTVAVVALR